jgi:polysaccharide biosynthesis/export protein
MKIVETKSVKTRFSKASSHSLDRRRGSMRQFAGTWICLMLLLAISAHDGLLADAVYPPIASPAKAATNLVTTNIAAMAAVKTNDEAKTKSPDTMETLDDKHTLALGDRLSFRIVEDEDGPKSLVVTDSGELEVPYIGRFRAVGLTCKQLAQALKAELEKEYYYQATVIIAVDVLSRTRGRIYLVGAVRAPGPQEIPSDEEFTLSKAILRAGGLGDYSDGRNVRITRTGVGPESKDQTIYVNVEKILEKGKRDGDLVLQPDDLIFIPEKLIRF